MIYSTATVPVNAPGQAPLTHATSRGNDLGPNTGIKPTREAGSA